MLILGSRVKGPAFLRRSLKLIYNYTAARAGRSQAQVDLCWGVRRAV